MFVHRESWMWMWHMGAQRYGISNQQWTRKNNTVQGYNVSRQSMETRIKQGQGMGQQQIWEQVMEVRTLTSGLQRL